jgi:hypothetical protein
MQMTISQYTNRARYESLGNSSRTTELALGHISNRLCLLMNRKSSIFLFHVAISVLVNLNSVDPTPLEIVSNA